MSHIVTLNLPNDVAERAQSVARQTNRRVEDVLLDWLGQAAGAAPVDSLPDDEVLALCDLQMSQSEQDELSALLGRQRERALDEAARKRLDTLMEIYRRGMVRKAQALKVAVERHLRPPIGATD